MKLIASVFILWVVLAGNIFAETSTSAKNPYVEERLSNEEKALYYKDPLKYMERLATQKEDSKERTFRALELSLYYQGWAPEVVFFRFDEKIKDSLLAVPTKKEMVMDVKMRDKEKALRWARESIEKRGRYPDRNPLGFLNLANLIYSKNPTKKEIEEFNEKYFWFKFDIFDFDGRLSFALGAGGVFAYSLYKGDMNFPIDIEMCQRILDRSNHLLWRNFYSGFFAPKDKEFAKYILSRSTDYWDMFALVDIYKGKYDSSDANPKLAEYWQKKAEKEEERFIGNVFCIWEQSDGKRCLRRTPYGPSDAKAKHTEHCQKQVKGAKEKFKGKIFTMWQLVDGWQYLRRIERNKAKAENPNISRKEMFELFDKKYNIIKYGTKQVRVRHPYYALRDDVVFEQVNPHYNRKLAEEIIQNILDNEHYIGVAIERLAFQSILIKYGVDQDLIERLFKKANNGLFDFMIKVDSGVPYGYEIFKKRMLDNF